MPLNDDAINFLKYAFTETKDLAEHFLTVVTAVLVFSLTFSEKIANFETAPTPVRVTITSAWSCMLLAIIACGIAICYVALSGGAASAGGGPQEYWPIMDKGIWWLGSGGILFVLGLVALLASVLQTSWKRK
jgi:hypothetical protein